MPACLVPVGQKAICAVKKIANWAAGAASLGAGDAFPFVAEGVERVPENINPRSLTGTVWLGHPIRLGEDIAGTIEVEADYRRFMVPLALAMGIAGVPATAEAATRFTHTLDMDEELCDIAATI